jgi:hypothetical protein
MWASECTLMLLIQECIGSRFMLIHVQGPSVKGSKTDMMRFTGHLKNQGVFNPQECSAVAQRSLELLIINHVGQPPVLNGALHMDQQPVGAGAGQSQSQLKEI